MAARAAAGNRPRPLALDARPTSGKTQSIPNAMRSSKLTAASIASGAASSPAMTATCLAIARLPALPEDPVLLDYNGRLSAREAFQRAADAAWPAHLPDAAVATGLHRRGGS